MDEWIGGWMDEWMNALVKRCFHPERMEITQPRVARNELPWVKCRQNLANPERVVSGRLPIGGTDQRRPRFGTDLILTRLSSVYNLHGTDDLF